LLPKALPRRNARFAELDFQACFGTVACFLERKAAPFGSRPRPMKFKMTNAAFAADRLQLTRPTTSHHLIDFNLSLLANAANLWRTKTPLEVNFQVLLGSNTIDNVKTM
jgi:hypothetical protein